MKNYNYALLNALHSVFWYNGLLDYTLYNDKDVYRGDEDIPLSVPIYDDSSVILRLINKLENNEKEYFTLDDMEEICSEFKWPHEYSPIWMILVIMFGDYGTSPRTGWIEKQKECAEFLKDIINIEEYCYKSNNIIRGMIYEE